MIVESSIISVGQELPPLHRPPSSNGRLPTCHQEHQGRAKDKHAGRKTDNRFAVLNGFVDFTLAGLTRNEIAVWLVLYRDTRDETARTGQNDLGHRAGISPRSVRRGIEGLKEKGLLEKTYQGGIGRGTSAYRISPFPPANMGHRCPPTAVNSVHRRGQSSVLHPIKDHNASP